MGPESNNSEDYIHFPDPELALEDGLLAIGGIITPNILLRAYSEGIFPWYSGNIPCWYHPDPRCVLIPESLRISKTMKQVIDRQLFEFTVNKDFNAVIHHCKNISRNEQDGTWITDEIERTFIELHQQGYAYSAEAWLNGELVGGLYGLLIGNVFFGESMFSKKSNASKFAFISWVQKLQQQGIVLIDCQVHSNHLESLGATMISRKQFMQILQSQLGNTDYKKSIKRSDTK